MILTTSAYESRPPAIARLTGVVAAALYLALLYIVSTALQGIFVVALYRFTTGESKGFNPHLIQGAFSTRPDLDPGR